MAISIPHISAQPRDNHAMPVAPLVTTFPYASAARGSSISTTIPSEVIAMVMVEATEELEALGTTNHPRGPVAEGSIPASPQAGSCATAALPAASLAALHTAHPTVYLTVSLTNLVANVLPSCTPRTSWRSSKLTALKPHFSPKVPHLLREHPMAKSHFTHGSSYPQRMA